MEKLENLITEQLSTYEALKNYLRNYKKDSKTRKTKIYMSNRVAVLDDYWVDFKKTHKDIIIAKASLKNIPKETQAYFDDEIYDIAEEIYIATKSVIEDDTLTLFPQEKENSEDNTASGLLKKQDEHHDRDEFKLPKMNLQSFSGDYKEWPSYEDIFNTLIHNNSKLSCVQKLHYLKSSLRGEAELLLRNFNVTDNNYVPAWNTLKERYKNQRLLIKAQLKDLFSIPSNTIDAPTAVRRLLDTANDCLQALRNLNIDVESRSFDIVITYVVCERLPPDTKKLWEQKIGASTEFPSFNELRTFLEGQFRALEALDVSSKRSVGIGRNVRQSFHIRKVFKCILCSGPHPIRKCENFLKLDYNGRREIVQKRGLCSNCLGHGHKSSFCPSLNTCMHCKHKHHTLLHNEMVISNHAKSNSPDPNNEVPTSSLSIREGVNSLHVSKLVSQNEVLLATALVKICSIQGHELTARALIDQGSQASFIAENITQLLGLKKSPAFVDIYGIENIKAGAARSKVNFELKSLYDDSAFKVNAFVMKSLTGLLPARNVAPRSDWSHLRNLELADPNYDVPGKIDLLLGADVHGKIIREKLKLSINGSPIAQHTALGWILSGEIQEGQEAQRHVVSCFCKADVDKQLKQFWELEDIKSECYLTPEEKACEEHFSQTVKRSVDGRYTVKLPFTNFENPHLGSSRATAMKRFQFLENKFNHFPELRGDYTKCIQEYEELDHMTPTSAEELRAAENGKIFYKSYYLPHHAVFKESTTTKLRVVFDASQRTVNGPSLNNVLMVGPKLQDDIISLLLRWRKHEIVFTADLEKMYRQIRVFDEDTNYQRILWRSNPTEPIKDYSLRTVTFGTACAPYLAIKTIQRLADDETGNYPLAAKVVKSDFYVDDLLSGAKTICEAVKLQRELIHLLKAGCFNLRKWTSNHVQLLEGIPPEDRDLSGMHNFELSEGIKTLGIFWCPRTDTFSYKINMEIDSNDAITKRSLLSEISKLYDPLGFLSPTIIRMKILMQSLWLKGIEWDENVPQDIFAAWDLFRKDLKSLEKCRIARWLGTKTETIEMHGFCDASNRAYAAAIYVRVVDDVGAIHTHLLTSKTKVAPIKQVSLPRLELCGATLLTRLFNIVKNSINFETIHVTFWTDSTIVLSWIRSHPSKWKSFVANRVSEIQDSTDTKSWRYVKTHDNPADCASRGMSPNDLYKCNIWWNGPTWLSQDKLNWPKSVPMEETHLEYRKQKVHFSVTASDNNGKLFTKYSSLSKLIRVTAYCFRFLNQCKVGRNNKLQHKWLCSDELNHALEYWIKDAQTEDFGEEIDKLNCSKPVTSGKICTLNPFLDGKGILRIGGRLQNSNLPWHEKHPIILSSSHPITTLIVHEMHARTLHGGPQLMIGLLRKNYWILKIRNTVRKIIHKCIICFRQKATVQAQLMGNLPSARTTCNRPFSHVGVDYCGPFDIRVSRGRGQKTHKGYLAVFICLAVRAVHLEVVSDLTSEAFHAALKRFVGRRGLCTDLYSDQGTNFIGANKLLQNDLKDHLKQLGDEIPELCSRLRINWHFMPPSAPHFGGLWEAGVKSTKHHLKRILGNTSLTYEEFATISIQIEACLNSRPIAPLTNDSTDLSALTPGHFLIGDALLAIPEPQLLNTQSNRLSRWKYLTQLTQSFWNRWQLEYLTRLQQRPKWMVKRTNLEVGNLVLIKDERCPPTKWLMARIIQLHPGTDNLVRVVTVKTKDHVLKRPITKLCLLPIYENEQLETKTKTVSQQPMDNNR